ncbi:MAG: cobalamin-dependent protein [Ignavibacteriales bacterium]|nr:MAG: cobalamin-dependent protein [Ignavibacteriales bacterium]
MRTLKEKQNISEVYFLDYFNNLIEGKKQRCSEIVKELLSQKTDIKDVYTDLYQRSLYRVGKMWDEGSLTVAEEHAASQITLELITSIKPKKSGKNKSVKKAIISCIDKEHHEIGALMVSNIFEFNGWDTKFLGASVPSKDLLKLIKSFKPELVGLSFNLYLNLLRLLNVIEHIRKFFPEQKIVIGGQAARLEKDNILKQFPDILYFDSLHELDSFIKNN